MKGLLISLILGLGFTSYSQTDEDIFNASKLYHGGSARFQALGGAMGAMGADVSSAQINPASYGRYSSSVFSITAGTNFNTTTSLFMGNESSATRTRFTIPSVAVVLVKDLSSKNKGNMFSQVGFGYNRISNFNQTISISGIQAPSLLDNFAGQAYGTHPSNLFTSFPFTSALAYETWAINYDQNTGSYTSYLQQDSKVNMNRVYQKTGGVNEFYFNYSMNRMNKLYWGFNLNLRQYNYTQNYKHSESIVNEPNNPFQSFDYSYNLKTAGTGVNAKIGVIYLVTNALRIGASFHTPTMMGLKDSWSADMTSYFTDSIKYVRSDLVPIGNYKYRMITPLKVNGSISYTIGTVATISTDIEYVAYSTGRLRAPFDPLYSNYNFNNENSTAKERLTNGVNFRLGGEFNIQQRFFIRGGFSLYSPAYKKSEGIDPKPDLSYSGGFGYKKGRVSIDLAYVNRQIYRTNYIYTGSDSAATRLTANQIIATFNVYF